MAVFLVVNCLSRADRMRRMAIDRSNPLIEITFRCHACRLTFKGKPGRVVDSPDFPHHPFEYFSSCPECSADVPQAAWERNLLKAHAHATGPRTQEGIAATTANLAGHPTPSEALRTRFNAMKHGLSARTANYFPAKPDGYAFCKGCEVDRVWCRSQPACQKQTQLFMMHHAAFEQRNPAVLAGLYADLQSAVFSVLQMILQTIIADGVKIEQPQWYTDKETGRTVIAEYINENGERVILKDMEAHPLFRPLGEMISRTGLSLSDMGMTPKAIEDEESSMGRLALESESKEELAAFREKMARNVEAMRGLFEKAQGKSARDPVLIEMQNQGDV